VPLSSEVRRTLDAIRPFLRGVLEFAPMASRPQACDFIAGNPEQPALPGYAEILHKWTDPRDRRWFAYGLGDPRAQHAAAEALTEELGIAFEADDILLSRGAHGALALAMRLVLERDDEVVFVSPPWFFYEALIIGSGGVPVRVRVDEATWDLDVDAIAAALTDRTRMVVVNTPNNPTGRIYPKETLERLGAALRDHRGATGRDVYLLCDEAYSKVLFDGNRMVSPVHWHDASFLVHTYSKSALAPGQRLGFLALPPTMPDREAFRMGARAVGVSTSNALPDNIMQYALPDIEANVLLDMKHLQVRRDRMLEALRSFGYEVRTPEATFYLLPKAPGGDDLAFARRLAAEDVLVLPGLACEMPGYFRISLTATDEMVERALPVFQRVIAAG
jgi:aspartate aminotransferase